MKDYKRLTGEKGSICDAEYCENDDCLSCAATINYDRLADLEDKIESGELCDREEVKKETAREILLLLGKGFDEQQKKNFKDLQWYEQFCRELKFRYGVDRVEVK